MEKLQQLKKDAFFALDIRAIPAEGMHLTLTADEEQRAYFAKQFDVVCIKQLQLNMFIKQKEDIIHMTGTMKGLLDQTCVVTLNVFEGDIDAEFHLMFSKNKKLVDAQSEKIDFDINDTQIDYIPKSTIYFKQVLIEQLGLHIDPFPKNTTEPFAYYEQKAEEVKINPFADLKHLTKK